MEPVIIVIHRFGFWNVRSSDQVITHSVGDDGDEKERG